MEIVYVIKKVKEASGKTTERNMTLPKKIWENIVRGDCKEANTTWELRKAKPVNYKEVNLMAKNNG